MANSTKTTAQLSVEKHTASLHRGFHLWPELKNGKLPALGDHRWTADLILSTWVQAETGKPPSNGLEHRMGNSGGGFDVLDFKLLPGDRRLSNDVAVDLSIPLNRRPYDRRIEIPFPFFGAGGACFSNPSRPWRWARRHTSREGARGCSGRPHGPRNPHA